MSSAYVVTTDQRILRYDSPPNKPLWLLTDTPNNRYHMYYKNCTCTKCRTEDHNVLIAYVPFESVTAVSFAAPNVVSGRLLTAGEKLSLNALKAWLDSSKRLPKKIKKINTNVLTVLAK